jgi:hypothetical protein
MDLDDVIPSPQYQICHSRVARAPLVAVWGRRNTSELVDSARHALWWAQAVTRRTVSA